jgi:DNA polymerase-3 subunit epsilon
MSLDLQVPWKTTRFVSIDLETTGTDTRNDRIIEIGLVVFENGEVVDRWQQLVHPDRDLPAVVTEVTGISAADLEGKPKLADVFDEFSRRISGELLLAYNHEFDLGVVAAEFERMGLTFVVPPCLDPLPLAWEYLRQTGLTKNAQLGTVSAHLGVKLDNAHRADADAEAAGRVLLRLAETVSLPEQLADLLQLQRVLLQRMNEHFARFRRGRTDNRSENRAVLGNEPVAIELGAAWLYGDEADPVRALIMRIPDVRDL